MQTDEFVRRVQEEGRIASGDDALRVIAATLESLGERLPRKERVTLAAQLPEQLRSYVNRRQESEAFTLQEFYNRVAARSDLGLPEAIARAQIVMGALQEAVSEGQLERVREELPRKFDELFSGEPYGPGSPAA